MAEPLKDKYGASVPKKIAGMISAVHKAFPSDAFIKDALDGYDALALLDRGKNIASALERHLPKDFPKASKILLRSLGPKLDDHHSFGMEPFIYMPHLYFIMRAGLEHFEESMLAQYEITQRFTAEFSVRAFIEKYPDACLQRLHDWTKDPSEHVRRLVSEGTRPRLPWASRLREFQRDPSPVIALLDKLKDDSSLYVRRSVANNLNDIGKDHPQILIDVCRRWLPDAPKERKWLINHALRSLVKAGNRDALALLGFGGAKGLTLQNGSISPKRAKIGEKIRICFDVKNESKKAQSVMVDFRVHYIKANGLARPKVFKLKAAELKAGETQRFEKSISLAEMTTRQHYTGKHVVDVLLNGQVFDLGAFQLG